MKRNRLTETEQARLVVWPLIPAPVRIIAMLAAHMPRERANDPLDAFTEAERNSIALSLSVLTAHLGTVASCMTGVQQSGGTVH